MQLGTKLLSAVAVAAAISLTGTSMAQECQNCGAGAAGANAPQLFANQYTQGGANQATAAMYTAPVPVPGWVGHTYYTYQPFYPHEMMNWHTDRYHSYYDNGRGLNSTKATYYRPPVMTGVGRIYRAIAIPRPPF